MKNGRIQVNWRVAQRKAAHTGKMAVTLAQVRITRVLAKTKWQLVTFCGERGGESVGIVDLLAVRKDHRPKQKGLKRGDALQIVLIQVKGGTARMPSLDDCRRLREVARHHRAQHILLAAWKKGGRVKFFRISSQLRSKTQWHEIIDLRTIFH